MSILATSRFYLDRIRLFWLGNLLLLLFLLLGCRAAPQFVRPQVPAPPAYKEASEGTTLQADGGTAAQIVAWKRAEPGDAAARGMWWQAFHDSDLNALEEQVLISNQNIAAATANYAAARMVVREARSQFYPTVTAGAAADRQRTLIIASSQPTAKTLTEYSAPLEATWEPDLWGRVRSASLSAVYSAQASAADLESVRLAAHAQVASNYFALCSQDSLKQVLDDAVANDRDTLAIAQHMYQAGLTTDEAVAAAEAELQAAQAADENTVILRAQYEHAIALLLGKAPAEFSLAVKPLKTEPAVAPLGVPADLLERRPDIAAAERAVAQANAQIGVARAAYFPSITLSASGGFSALTPADWFSWPSRVWAVGPAIAEAIFDGGLRTATVQQYRAYYDAAVASYRQTALAAFQQVEDQLAALRILQGEIVQQNAAVRSAQRTLQEAKVRYEAGLDPYLNVIQAQTAVLSYQQMLITLRSQQMSASVQLMEALGGGWQASELPDTKNVRTNK